MDTRWVRGRVKGQLFTFLVVLMRGEGGLNLFPSQTLRIHIRVVHIHAAPLALNHSILDFQ